MRSQRRRAPKKGKLKPFAESLEVPRSEAWRRAYQERHELTVRILQKIDRLLDELPDRPELVEPINAQIAALSRILRELAEEPEPPE